MERIVSWDRKLATFEGWVATFVLLSMIVVATVQAVLFNIAQHDVAWAAKALMSVDWADTYLQKGTLWLAFLGASLATHEDKHIAIDVLTKFLSPKADRIVRFVVSAATAVVCVVLSRVFLQAGLAADATIPFDYEVLTPEGGRHICDVASGLLGDRSRPGLFCAVRGAFSAIGIPSNSGAGIAQLIVPLMFLVIAARFVLRAITSFSRPDSEHPPGREAVGHSPI